MNEDWTDRLRQQVGNFELEPPDGLLDDIKEEMAHRATTKRRRVVGLWRPSLWRAAAAAAVVLIVSAVGLWLLQPAADLRPGAEVASASGGSGCTAAEFGSVKHPTADAQIAASGKALAACAGTVRHRDVVAQRAAAASGAAQLGEASEDDNVVSLPADEPAAVGASGAMAKKKAAPAAKRQTEAKEIRSEAESSHERLYASSGSAPTVLAASNGARRLTVAASYQGNGMSSSRNGAFSGVNELYEAKLPGVLLGDVPGKESNAADVRTRHNQPVRAGVSVRYGLTPRWSVQTGLTYSYLRSSFDVLQNGVSNSTDQSLHYLGVPVDVVCDVWRGGRFGVYALAGGMGEMLVSGTAKSRYTLGGKEWQQQSSRVKDGRVLWSVNAAVGAECDVVKGVSLYVEPGCSYHFDNGSPVQSAYTDRRFAFDLNFGLRVKLP